MNINTVDLIPFSQLSTADEYFGIPDQFRIYQNYPNPFNPFTTIRYNLPEAAHVQIVIYDLLGHEVKSLLNEYIHPGYQSIIWDATNNKGESVSGGVYIYSILSAKFNASRKMVLLK
jgi:hypothetical protein